MSWIISDSLLDHSSVLLKSGLNLLLFLFRKVEVVQKKFLWIVDPLCSHEYSSVNVVVKMANATSSRAPREYMIAFGDAAERLHCVEFGLGKFSC